MGGRAADAIDGLASSLRHRLDAVAEARSLSAQARLSAVVVGAAPLGYLAFSAMVDPGAVTALVATGVGRVCLVVGLGLEALAGSLDPAHPEVGRVRATTMLPWVLGAAWGIAVAVPLARRAGAGPGRGARHLAGVGPAIATGAARAVVATRGAGGASTPTVWSSGSCAHSARIGASAVPTPRSPATCPSPSICSASRSARGARRTSRWRSRRSGRRHRWRSRSTTSCAVARSASTSNTRSKRSPAPGRACVRWPTRCSPPTGSGCRSGPVLARLAEEDRTALRRAAEAHARRIPVRLLFPLVFLVLPAFVLLTVVPGLAAGLGRL